MQVLAARVMHRHRRPQAPSETQPGRPAAAGRRQLQSMLLLLAVAMALGASSAQVPPCGSAALAAHACTPQGIYSAHGADVDVPRVLYAEHFGSADDDWGVRINLAIQRAFVAPPSIIELPVGRLNVSVPIKLWRTRKSTHADTTADSVREFASIGQCWEAIKGGEPADLPKGFRLRGVPGGGYASSVGASHLRWTGNNNSVMLDMPAPWHTYVSDLMLDGDGTPGVIGIRYRAGYVRKRVVMTSLPPHCANFD